MSKSTNVDNASTVFGGAFACVGVGGDGGDGGGGGSDAPVNLIANFADNVEGTAATPTVNGDVIELVGTGSFSRMHNDVDVPTLDPDKNYLLSFEMATTDGTSDIWLYHNTTTTVSRTRFSADPDGTGEFVTYGLIVDTTQLEDDTPVIGFDGNDQHDFRNIVLYELPIASGEGSGEGGGGEPAPIIGFDLGWKVQSTATTSSSGYATKGEVITVDANVSLVYIACAYNGAASDLIMTIGEVSGSGASWTLDSIVYQSPTHAVTGDPTEVSFYLGGLELSAGTTYAFMLTRTDASGGTPCYCEFSTSAGGSNDHFTAEAAIRYQSTDPQLLDSVAYSTSTSVPFDIWYNLT